MPDSPVDPSTLNGDALKRWYQRSPADIEQERQAARLQNYNNFFGSLRSSPSTTDDSSQPSDTWSAPGYAFASPTSAKPRGDAVLDTTGAGPNDDGTLSLVGNSANPRLRGEWQRKWGQAWPRDPDTGRNYDVAHIVAKADGGADHVDNIRPLHPDAHRAEHMANGDYERWGGWSRGRPPSEPMVRGLGLLQIIPDITGILSGRIRTDNFDNFASDMMGLPSQEDQRRALENQQRQLNPNWKPGDPIIF
jgi:hypothetical protein